MTSAPNADPLYEDQRTQEGTFAMTGERGLNRRAALGVMGTASALAGAVRAQPPAAPPLGQLVARPSRGVCGKMTGGEAIVRALWLEQTPCVFGIPGAQNNDFWDAMKSHGLPYFLVAHESSASVMADAASRVTGQVGTCSVVPGPGLTNALTGLGEALLDTVPLVALVTDVDRSPTAPSFQVHQLPGAAIARPVCKLVIETRQVSQVAGAVHQAFAVARTPPQGPVAVIVPFPLLKESWSFDETMPAAYAVPFDEGAYQRALALLGDRRQRVGIYVGQGTFHAGPQVAAVANLLQAPVATTVSGKGAVPDDFPWAVGWGYGAQGTLAAENAFKDVDMVLAVGARYSEVSTAGYAVPPREPLVHVDADPEALGKNVAVTVPVHADARAFFDRLLADGSRVARPRDPELVRRVALWRQEDRRTYATPQVSKAVDPMYLVHCVRCALPPEALIFADVTSATHWAAECVHVPGPRRYFAPSNNQSMGWSVPAAIAGAKVAPGRPVVAIVGDGCFLMSGMETSSAARAGLPVVFVVLDDGAYHYMQMLQEPMFRRTTATEIAQVDYAAFARAMGLGYVRVDANGQAPGAVRAALAMRGPVLLHATISYEGRELRWLSAARKHYLQQMARGEQAKLAGRVVARSALPQPADD